MARCDPERAPRRACLVLGALALIAAPRCRFGQYTVELRFAPDAPLAQAASIDVYVLRACPGPEALGADPAAQPLAAQTFAPNTAAMPLGDLPPGRVAVYARARDVGCGVYAAGCTETSVVARGSGVIAVDLARAMVTGACAPGVVCSAGRCGGLPDAGVDGDAGADGGACTAAAAAMPVISRNAPATASDTCSDRAPGNADDTNYATAWRACTPPSATRPVWIAYDLSSVPAAQRGRVLVSWYADNHQWEIVPGHYPGYNVPGDYTIDAAVGRAMPAPDAPAWVNLATARNNVFHAGHHVVDLTSASGPYDWLRLRFTASNGTTDNDDIDVQIDVQDAARATDDQLLALGDNWSAGVFAQDVAVSADDGTFAQLVQRRDPSHARFPAVDNAWSDVHDLGDLDTLVAWVRASSARYVVLGQGMQRVFDGTGCDAACAQAFGDELRALVRTTSSNPNGCTTFLLGHLPQPLQRAAMVAAMNAQVDMVLADNPQVRRGSDLWAAFAGHPEYFEPGTTALSRAGEHAVRAAWVEALYAAGGLYGP